ncbi:unnamed protein product [Pleuronectes platessa]|uniref:Uncharacterized protein n=1 Tax=Pleuronectes platessa TaxID=8262 RepID=A0A9N7UTU5_PLEPL|nr:unnamed protein product [Pleuronectes platessa]
MRHRSRSGVHVPSPGRVTTAAAADDSEEEEEEEEEEESFTPGPEQEEQEEQRGGDTSNQEAGRRLMRRRRGGGDRRPPRDRPTELLTGVSERDAGSSLHRPVRSGPPQPSTGSRPLVPPGRETSAFIPSPGLSADSH